MDGHQIIVANVLSYLPWQEYAELLIPEYPFAEAIWRSSTNFQCIKSGKRTTYFCNGVVHRDNDEPAVVEEDRIIIAQRFYRNGNLYRNKITHSNGHREEWWYYDNVRYHHVQVTRQGTVYESSRISPTLTFSVKTRPNGYRRESTCERSTQPDCFSARTIVYAPNGYRRLCYWNVTEYQWKIHSPIPSEPAVIEIFPTGQRRERYYHNGALLNTVNIRPLKSIV